MPDTDDLATLLARHDKPGPRYTSYPTAVEFHDGVDEAAYLRALADAAVVDEPLSLYLHLPFCAERCLYCACNVVITQRPEVSDPYLRHLRHEIDLVAAHLGTARPVRQFHFGGGTPTYYTPAQLAELTGFVRDRFPFAPDAEVALEADPRVTTAQHLEVLAGHGFNRLSLGVQDFDPRVQEAVHRVQGFQDTLRLVEAARRYGFTSINVDLIHGLPYQTPSSFARTVDQVLRMAPDRLAVYSFAHVPWIAPHQKRLPEEAIPRGEDKYRLLATARERLTGAGYLDVGMDHFARPDDELAQAQREGRLSRNFMGYTPVRAGDVIGLGLSAIGEVQGRFVQNHRKLNRYQDALSKDRLPTARGYELSDDDRVRQHLIREWMCNLHLPVRDLEARFDLSFDGYFAEERDEIDALVRDGFLEPSEDGYHAGPLGRMFLRNVAMVFDRHLRHRTRERPTFSRTV